MYSMAFVTFIPMGTHHLVLHFLYFLLFLKTSFVHLDLKPENIIQSGRAWKVLLRYAPPRFNLPLPLCR